MTVKHQTLEGKTALVTGGARRIGRAIVLRLASSGVNVAVHYNTSEEAAEKTVAETLDRGVRAWKIRADLADESQAEDLISAVLDRTGRLDFLINNASVFTPSTLETITAGNLIRTLAVNAFAPLVLVRTFARGVNGGAVVNILDSRIRCVDTDHVAYQLSKDMLSSLTRLMAAEYAPRVRVNGIAPGLILSPAGKDGSHIKERLSKNILHRTGSPEDVAEAVIFLLSNPFVTGEIIFMDGGENVRRDRS